MPGGPQRPLPLPLLPVQPLVNAVLQLAVRLLPAQAWGAQGCHGWRL